MKPTAIPYNPALKVGSPTEVVQMATMGQDTASDAAAMERRRRRRRRRRY